MTTSIVTSTASSMAMATPPNLLLLLHGIPDTGRVWGPLARALAPDLPCRAPDLPGFGAATVPFRPRHLDDLAAAIEAMLADRPAARVVLVAHDVGGLFALAWAAARPRRVAALVLVNTSVFGDRRWHWGARILKAPGLGAAAVRLMPRVAFARELKRAAAGHLDDATIAATHAAFGLTARRTARALYRLQRPCVLEDLAERVRALTRVFPTLVVWGDRDPYLPPAFAERFAARTVVHHPELGHWPHREAPTRVAGDIRGFLAELGLWPT